MDPDTIRGPEDLGTETGLVPESVLVTKTKCVDGGYGKVSRVPEASHLSPVRHTLAGLLSRVVRTSLVDVGRL